jgi:hypothetical protein
MSYRIYTSPHGENKDRTTQLHGNRVVWCVAVHHRLFAPHILEGRVRDCIVAVLSWRDVRHDAALGAFVKLECLLFLRRQPEQISCSD